MKIKIFFSLLFIVLTVFSFAGNNLTKDDVTQGKWMNKSDGYYPTPIMPEEEANVKTVSRFKTIVFREDGTFSMDSAKHDYPGKYYIDGEKVKLVFEKTTVVHYSKNTDPNTTSRGYVTTPAEIKLDSREGEIVDGKLVFNDGFEFENRSAAMHGLLKFYEFTGFANASFGHIIMLFIGLVFIFLAIRYNYEPLLLIPIGVGILIGNIPMFQAVDFNLKLGIYEPGSVMNILYGGVVQGWFPPLIFLGIGAMTDFSSLISNPRLMLLGAAAQFGVFATFLLALMVGFHPAEAGAIGIIGGADGPTAIFISSKLANGVNVIGFDPLGAPIYVKNLIGPIAIAAYSYMALVPVIQPPVVNLLTTKKERKIKMRPPRSVSKIEKIIFPIVGLLLTAYLSPTALPLLGMLFFGNILKESGATRRLAETAANPLIDTITILLGLTVGASTQADVFLTSDSVLIFVMGALSFVLATAMGVMAAKLMNWMSPKSNPVNPIIGCAGVSAVPDSARVAQELGHKADSTNYLLMHAMAPNVSGVIGSAVAAGIILSFLL
jgi:oxaloacetate decarboxylase beta subunit